MPNYKFQCQIINLNIYLCKEIPVKSHILVFLLNSLLYITSNLLELLPNIGLILFKFFSAIWFVNISGGIFFFSDSSKIYFIKLGIEYSYVLSKWVYFSDSVIDPKNSLAQLKMIDYGVRNCINKNYNRLNFLDNLISLLFISFYSLKKYGGKNIF